jgi:branched-chain amino acid transport system substrate-binding protein
VFRLPRWILLLLPCVALAGCTPPGPTESLLFGHVAPFSGPARAVGEHEKLAIDLATEDARKDPQRAFRDINVSHADCHSDKDSDDKTAAAEAVRLVSVNRVTALVDGTAPSQLEPVARALQPYSVPPYSVPLLTPAPLAEAPFNDNVFSLTAAPAYKGQVLAQFVRDELKADAVAVVADDRDPASAAVAAAFSKEFRKGNEAAVIDVPSSHGKPDVSALAAHFKEKPPKAVVVALPLREVVKLRADLHAAAGEAPLLYGVEEAGWDELGEAPATAGKLYLASVFAADGLTQPGQDFAKRFQEKAGSELDSRSALAYEAVRVLVTAAARARGSAGPLLRKELGGSEEFDGLTGKVGFTKEHAARRPVFVLHREGGKTTLDKKYDAEPRPS